MLLIKNSQHLRTCRHLQGFRACRTSTGLSRAAAARLRLRQEDLALARRQRRRLYLAQSWRLHQEACHNRREWRGGVSP